MRTEVRKKRARVQFNTLTIGIHFENINFFGNNQVKTGKTHAFPIAHLLPFRVRVDKWFIWLCAFFCLLITWVLVVSANKRKSCWTKYANEEKKYATTFNIFERVVTLYRLRNVFFLSKQSLTRKWTVAGSDSSGDGFRFVKHVRRN